MEPIMLTLALIGFGIAISTAAATIFWPKIVGWAFNNLFPWVEANMPYLKSDVREAFALIDKFATPAYDVIKKKWEKVRRHLLKVVERFELRHGTWVLQTTSWIRKSLEELEPDQIEVEEIRTEHRVEWHELPAEIRQAAAKVEKRVHEIDFTKLRDAELELDLSA